MILRVSLVRPTSFLIHPDLSRMSIEKALPFRALLFDRIIRILRMMILDAFSPFPDETEKGQLRP
jgi:hypothetical protein